MGVVIMTRFDIAISESVDELGRKGLREIQIETAYKWAGRAIAAKMMGIGGDAHEYAHEAIEHAALSGDFALLHEIRERFEANGVVVLEGREGKKMNDNVREFPASNDVVLRAITNAIQEYIKAIPKPDPQASEKMLYDNVVLQLCLGHGVEVALDAAKKVIEERRKLFAEVKE
jgi:hypothetical protein